MSLSTNKILVSQTFTNTPSAVLQPVIITSIGIGNLTAMNAGVSSAQFVPAGVYIMPYSTTSNVSIEVNTYQNATGVAVNNWVAYVAVNTGGTTILSDGWNVRANASTATQSLTLYTSNGGNAVIGTYNV